MGEASRRDPVRSFANQIFLAISGRWLRAYSIVRHVGRTSGRTYRNPVSAYPLGDGFVIPVLYGTQSQWVRNVMAAGRFTLRTKGRDYLLERPEIIPPAQALAAYPTLLRRLMRAQDPGLRLGAPCWAVDQVSQRRAVVCWIWDGTSGGNGTKER
jgi:deazaflavin-dependent oxidoreductase (nitroreductase family)